MNRLEKIRNRIYDKGRLQQALSQWKSEGKRIVFTNGCFDILHRGHVEYLAEAADMGDILIIGLNSDASVTRLKGPNRPIIDGHSRCMLLAALDFVDAVICFDEDTPYRLISQIHPDVLVKGGDYTEDRIVGADIVRADGGQICSIPLRPGCSTSLIEAKIKNQD